MKKRPQKEQTFTNVLPIKTFRSHLIVEKQFFVRLVLDWWDTIPMMSIIDKKPASVKLSATEKFYPKPTDLEPLALID